MVVLVFMASSSSSHNYEVFLNFRGIDTRRNFTDHLYRALDRVGVRTFRDNEELKQGEEIGPELLKAIKESKISIPVFSKNYASSKWCLKELAKTMECRETDGQVVWPIFYKVEPSDVRKQSGSFAQAFLEYEETQSKETLDEWREALSKAGSLSGWDSEDPKNSYETTMIDSIVEKALNELNKNTLEVAEHPIGMDARVEEVLRLIDVESKEVQFVGIHGIGGIGKTTIAKAVFNRIFHHFQGYYFLQDVRERASQYSGLVNLQNELVSKVLNINKMHISIADEGINLIKERFCSKKVLIILDDVDEGEQLNKLASKHDWFGLGSTIIITTRDKHILNVNLVDGSKIYMPNELDVNQSLQLFSNHAFGRDQPPKDFRELSKKFLGIIGGLPLALKVLGSFLRDKRRPTEWESALEKLNKIPDAKVQGSLRISYDGLEDEDKEILLDIACFFIGMDEETVIHILEDNSPRIRIKVLVLKSLVRIDHDNKLTMHDLIRDMGREIVRQKNPKNLGKRSRLWSHEEALYVLKKRKGTENIEGLRLNFGYIANNDRYLKVEAFEKMSELRLLQIDHACLEGNFDHFPGELKWLSWKGLHWECIPTISHLEKLSVLDLSGGMITDDWSGWQHIQLIKTLKVLDLRYCLCLTKTPDFSSLTSLERLILDHCRGLVVCHESIGQLKNLDFLSLKGCSNLVELPDSISSFSCLSRLQTLDLSSCQQLQSLLELPSSLIKLDARGCPSMERLPELSNLKFLQELDISDCGKLSKIQGISGLPLLKKLCLRSCTTLQSLPELPSSLVTLDISQCISLEILPNMSNLKNLEHICLDNCKKLVEIQGLKGLILLQKLRLVQCGTLRSLLELPSSLIMLDARGCSSMERLPELSNLKFLQELDLSDCGKLSEIQGISGLPLLKKLCLRSFTTLQSLPELPSSLEHICLNNCKKLVEIQGMKGLILLQKLHLVECGKLQSFPELPLGNLRELFIRDCRNLSKIQGISCLPRLQILSLRCCEKLQSLPMLPSSLVSLQAYGFNSMERLPDMSNLKNLEALDLLEFDNLAEIHGISDLPLLRTLYLTVCSKLQSLPKLPSSLIRLEAYDCSSLERLPDMSNLIMLEVLNLRCCNNLADIRGLEGLESLISLRLSECHTCIQNFQKTVAQGILSSASDKLKVQKQYLIPDDDSINGMVFFLVFKLSRWFLAYSCSCDNISVDITAEVERKNCARIKWYIRLRLESWKNTDIVDQFYSCYFQGLTWFGFPLKKGDILKLSEVLGNSSCGWSVSMKMAEFVVADEAMEDSEQLEKGVKHLITCIREQNVVSQTKMLNISQILSENSLVVQPYRM